MDRKEYPSVEIQETQAKVSLLLRSTAPIDNNLLSEEEVTTLNSATVIAGEAARTCYSSQLQTALDYIYKSDKYRQITNEVVSSTKEAGHLTTRQHVYYTFGIENISRHAVYFLHSHPYNNSEMMSQRYVNLAETKPIIPDYGSPELNNKASEAATDLLSGYNRLYKLLTPTTKELILERFPGRDNSKWQKQIDIEAGKKSQEIARYLLTIGTPSNLQHTISELTLLRLHHLSQTMPVHSEITNIVNGMVSVVAGQDPSILNELYAPLEPIRTTISPDFAAFAEEFDELIETYPIKLDTDGDSLSHKLARAVRLTLGQSSKTLPDDEALDMLLNPANNMLLSSTSGDIVLDRLSQSLNQISISALVSLSHVANEQFHRHRIFNHTEQQLLPIPEKTNDFIIPTILEKNQEAYDLYVSILESHHQTLRELKDSGCSLESLQYLLTNATRIRKSISGPFGSIYHFIKLRTCLTTQEEIYHLAISLTKQICELDPKLGKYLQKPSPCGIRYQAHRKPFCSEGNHYCGIRIWDLSIKDFPKRFI